MNVTFYPHDVFEALFTKQFSGVTNAVLWIPAHSGLISMYLMHWTLVLPCLGIFTIFSKSFTSVQFISQCVVLFLLFVAIALNFTLIVVDSTDPYNMLIYCKLSNLVSRSTKSGSLISRSTMVGSFLYLPRLIVPNWSI